MSSSNPKGRHLRSVHPIWRGVGCILMVLVPLAGFRLTNWGINYLLENSPEFTSNLTRGVYPADTILYMRIGGTIIASLVVFFAIVLVSSLFVSIWGDDETEDEDRQGYKSYRSRPN